MIVSLKIDNNAFYLWLPVSLYFVLENKDFTCLEKLQMYYMSLRLFLSFSHYLNRKKDRHNQKFTYLCSEGRNRQEWVFCLKFSVTSIFNGFFLQPSFKRI